MAIVAGPAGGDGRTVALVKNLIDQVSSKTGRAAFSDNILDVFDRISGPGGGGYVLSPQYLMLRGRPAAGTIDGSLANIGVAGTTPPTVIISPNDYYNPIYLEHEQAPYTMTALHETIHLSAASGFYSDLDLALAAYDVLAPTGSLSQKEIDEFNMINKKDPFSASAWWGGVLTKRCN